MFTCLSLSCQQALKAGEKGKTKNQITKQNKKKIKIERRSDNSDNSSLPGGHSQCWDVTETPDTEGFGYPDFGCDPTWLWADLPWQEPNFSPAWQSSI